LLDQSKNASKSNGKSLANPEFELLDRSDAHLTVPRSFVQPRRTLASFKKCAASDVGREPGEKALSRGEAKDHAFGIV
jgi:hypothetical protein